MKTGEIAGWKWFFHPWWPIINGCEPIEPGRMVHTGRQDGGQEWITFPGYTERCHIDWENGHMTWVDATLQAILSAKILMQMAALLGREAEVRIYGKKSTVDPLFQ